MDGKSIGKKQSEELLSSLKKLFDTQEYADFTLRCRNDKYNLHKAIVCPRSKVIARALDGRFEEARTSEIDFKEDNPQIVRRMVHYFYHLDYPTVLPAAPESGVDTALEDIFAQNSAAPAEVPPPIEEPLAEEESPLPEMPDEPAPWPELEPAPDPYDAGEEYIPASAGDQSADDVELAAAVEEAREAVAETPAAVEEAREAVAETPAAVEEAPEAVAETPAASILSVHAKTYALADKYDIQGLKALAVDKFSVALQNHWNDPDFSQAAEIVYETSVPEDRGLRDLVVQTLHRHESIADKDDVKKVLKRVGDLSFDLIMYVRAKGGWESHEPLEPEDNW